MVMMNWVGPVFLHADLFCCSLTVPLSDLRHSRP